MNRKLKSLLVFCLLASTVFLNGCWGKREVEELAPLMGVGIDRGNTPGKFLITEQYALPKKGATAAEVEGRTYSVEVSSARQMNEKTSEILKRVPFMGSLKVVVIGEGAAKAGFNDVLDFAQRFSEFRRSMYLVLAKGKAEDFLNLKLPNDELPSMYLISKLETAGNISVYPKVRLGHYLTVLSTKNMAPILPVVQIIEQSDENIQYHSQSNGDTEEAQVEGAGVLKGDHLVAYLTDTETKGFMWLDNQVKNRFLNTANKTDSSIHFGGHVLASKTKYKVVNNNGAIGLKYQINVSAAIDEVLGLKEQLSDTQLEALVEGAEKDFAKVITQECQLSLQKERELGLDFLGIGRRLEEFKPAYWKSIKDQWGSKIADFPVSINVQVTIHHEGMTGNSITTR